MSSATDDLRDNPLVGLFATEAFLDKPGASDDLRVKFGTFILTGGAFLVAVRCCPASSGPPESGAAEVLRDRLGDCAL